MGVKNYHLKGMQFSNETPNWGGGGGGGANFPWENPT